MRLTLASLLVLVLGLLTPVSAWAECAPKRGAKTLAKNRHAIVIKTKRSDSYDEIQYTTVWACLRRSRRWQRIQRTESSTVSVDDIRQVRLAGTRMAYAWEFGDPRQDVVVRVRVYDIRARRRTTDARPPGYQPYLARVVLAASGTVAFSMLEYDFEGDPPKPSPHRRIYTARGEHATAIDDGRAVRLHSLQVRGSELTWLHGDQTRTVTLR